MYCPKCGSNNLDAAKFCAKCGAPMQVAAMAGRPSTPPPEAGAVAAGKPAVTNELKWGIVAGSVLLPLVGIVMGIVYWMDANPEKKAVGKLWLWTGIGLGILYALMFG